VSAAVPRARPPLAVAVAVPGAYWAPRTIWAGHIRTCRRRWRPRCSARRSSGRRSCCRGRPRLRRQPRPVLARSAPDGRSGRALRHDLAERPAVLQHDQHAPVPGRQGDPGRPVRPVPHLPALPATGRPGEVPVRRGRRVSGRPVRRAEPGAVPARSAHRDDLGVHLPASNRDGPGRLRVRRQVRLSTADPAQHPAQPRPKQPGAGGLPVHDQRRLPRRHRRRCPAGQHYCPVLHRRRAEPVPGNG
jgi:hypothetical protein